MADTLLLNHVIDEPEELVDKLMHCLLPILEVKIQSSILEAVFPDGYFLNFLISFNKSRAALLKQTTSTLFYITRTELLAMLIHGMLWNLCSYERLLLIDLTNKTFKTLPILMHVQLNNQVYTLFIGDHPSVYNSEYQRSIFQQMHLVGYTVRPLRYPLIYSQLHASAALLPSKYLLVRFLRWKQKQFPPE